MIDIINNIRIRTVKFDSFIEGTILSHAVITSYVLFEYLLGFYIRVAHRCGRLTVKSSNRQGPRFSAYFSWHGFDSGLRLACSNYLFILWRLIFPVIYRTIITRCSTGRQYHNKIGFPVPDAIGCHHQWISWYMHDCKLNCFIWHTFNRETSRTRVNYSTRILRWK